MGRFLRSAPTHTHAPAHKCTPIRTLTCTDRHTRGPTVERRKESIFRNSSLFLSLWCVPEAVSGVGGTPKPLSHNLAHAIGRHSTHCTAARPRRKAGDNRLKQFDGILPRVQVWDSQSGEGGAESG